MKKGEATHYRVYEENPEMKKIESIVQLLRDGGVIIYPTDTIYAMGCDLFNRQAVELICRIKGIKPSKAVFSLIGDDISQIAEYAKNLTTPLFKIMKKATPGPFTFILQASNKIPRSLDANRKTIGLRIPDNNIPRVIARELGNPLITTSIRDEDDVIEYVTDPDLIYEKYAKEVDAVIDGGVGKNVASTIVDCTGDELEIIREGLGDITTL
jgi:tRNA threonylcarbamoyl adenosine modification protein (Sua5/YciO/YrdC/YwlC family)